MLLRILINWGIGFLIIFIDDEWRMCSLFRWRENETQLRERQNKFTSARDKIIREFLSTRCVVVSAAAELEFTFTCSPKSVLVASSLCSDICELTIIFWVRVIEEIHPVKNGIACCSFQQVACIGELRRTVLCSSVNYCILVIFNSGRIIHQLIEHILGIKLKREILNKTSSKFYADVNVPKVT